ncbi:MAG TPA: sodium:solute symporter family protein [Acidobacteriota bacterium]|nr:sodium:solute symporter family protein [Acidobacteriota bacterium]
MPNPAPETATAVLAAVIAYLLIVFVLGLRSRCKGGGEAGYYLAGRSLGPLAATSTLAATVIGGSATIIVVGQVYLRGLPAIWIDLAGGLGLLLLGLLLAARVRRLGLFSLPEIAGAFYGGAVRKIAAILVLLAQIGWLALLLRSCVALLQPVTGADTMLLLLPVGGVFIIYTVVGGQLAVARTDVLQLLLMAVGILLVAAPVLGFTAAWETLPPEKTAFPTGPGMPVSMVLSLIAVTALPHLAGSDIYSKLLSARDEKTACTAALAAGAIKIIFGIAIGLIGLAAITILPSGIAADSVLSVLALEVLPAPVTALIIVALLATLMSSADSVLLTAGTVLTRDIFERRNPAEGRVATAVIGLVGIAFAALFADLLDIFFFAYAFFSAGLTLPVLFGFWRERLGLNTAGAAASMAGGAIAVILGRVSGYSSELVSAGGLAASLILLFAVSNIWRIFQRNQ